MANLPELSTEEYELFNLMAVRMDYFHEWFRRTWKKMSETCKEGVEPTDRPSQKLISTGLDFCHSLEAHHRAEERMMFPMLARKMPAFADELQMPSQHSQIHDGLKRLEVYLVECWKGGKQLRFEEVRELMDSFGDVLFRHLDAEVEQLGAPNMKMFWTVDEMKEMRYRVGG